VAVGLLPVTGQPLPLISRGGTAGIIFSVYFGIFISISNYECKSKKAAETATATDGSAPAEETGKVETETPQ
jgi:cell division protein FtsW